MPDPRMLSNWWGVNVNDPFGSAPVQGPPGGAPVDQLLASVLGHVPLSPVGLAVSHDQSGYVPQAMSVPAQYSPSLSSRTHKPTDPAFIPGTKEYKQRLDREKTLHTHAEQDIKEAQDKASNATTPAARVPKGPVVLAATQQPVQRQPMTPIEEMNAGRDQRVAEADAAAKQEIQRQKIANMSIETKGDTINVKNAPMSLWNSFQQVLGEHQQMIQQQNDQYAAQQNLVQRRIMAAQQNPLINVLGQLSANMAQQPDMPGWVRALGATAQQVNPSADKLRQQYNELGAQRAGLSAQAVQAAQAGMNAEKSQYEMGLQERQFQSGEKLKSLQEQQLMQAMANDAIGSYLKSGIAMTPEQRAASKADLKQIGYTDAAADAKVNSIDKQATAAGKAAREAETFKTNEGIRKSIAEIHEQQKALDAKASAEDRKLWSNVNMKYFAQEHTKAPVKVLEEISGHSESLGFFDDLRELLKNPEIAKYLGPKFSGGQFQRMLNGNELLGLLQKPEFTTIVAKTAHELPRVARLTNALSRAYTKDNIKNVIDPLTAKVDLTPENFIAKLNVASQTHSSMLNRKAATYYQFDIPANAFYGGAGGQAYQEYLKSRKEFLDKNNEEKQAMFQGITGRPYGGGSPQEAQPQQAVPKARIKFVVDPSDPTKLKQVQ